MEYHCKGLTRVHKRSIYHHGDAVYIVSAITQPSIPNK